MIVIYIATSIPRLWALCLQYSFSYNSHSVKACWTEQVNEGKMNEWFMWVYQGGKKGEFCGFLCIWVISIKFLFCVCFTPLTLLHLCKVCGNFLTHSSLLICSLFLSSFACQISRNKSMWDVLNIWNQAPCHDMSTLPGEFPTNTLIRKTQLKNYSP